jgi:hypothetical protein
LLYAFVLICHGFSTNLQHHLLQSVRFISTLVRLSDKLARSSSDFQVKDRSIPIAQVLIIYLIGDSMNLTL